MKLSEIRENLVKGDMFARIIENRFGDYIEIVKKGSSEPVAYITLNKGDDVSNSKVRRDLIDIESEREFNREWNDHLPLIEKFVDQLKDTGFNVEVKPNRSIGGVKIYANQLTISINFGCIDNDMFSRNATIYVNNEVLWSSTTAGVDRIIKLLSSPEGYIKALINDQARSTEEIDHWFKQLDLSDE